MSEAKEKVYESPPSELEDDFWLEQGQRMLVESITSVRSAANACIITLGILQGIYLGILGFAKLIPAGSSLGLRILFIFPLISWIFSLFLCVEVMMTGRIEVYLRSPSDIRNKLTRYTLQKQRYLEIAFWLITLGLVGACWLLLWRMSLS